MGAFIIQRKVRTWLVPDDNIQLSHICLGFFYADDVMVGSRDSGWLQHLMNVLIGLFRRYGLVVNFNKSRAMKCQPDALSIGMSEESKKLKCTGVRYSYHERLRRLISCPECRVKIIAGSMTSHRIQMHRMEPVIERNRLLISQTGHHPQVYDVRFPWITK